MKKLSSAILAGLFFAAGVSAQPASITWPLNGSTQLNPAAPVGNVTGAMEIVSPGTAPSMSVKDYWPGHSPEGQRLWAGAAVWPMGTEAADRFIEFNASPTGGNILSVKYVSFNFGGAGNHYGGSGVSGRIRSMAYYSIDGWLTRTLITTSGPLQYPKATMASLVSNYPVFPPVAHGSTFSVRIHPFAVGVATVAPYFATHNMVTIAGTTAPADPATSSICGTKFNDLNGNGTQDAGEPGIKGWQISIGGQSVTTDENGNYCFIDLMPGDYTINEIKQSGWEQTAPLSGHHTVALAAGQNLVGKNFGNRRVASDSPVKPDGPIAVGPISVNPDLVMHAQPGSICGIKYYDINRNGVRDERGEGEPVLPGWTISISGPVNTTVITNAQGDYCFTGLPAGTYTIAEVLQSNWQQTAPTPGNYTVTLAAGEELSGMNFGNWRVPGFPSAISGTKFNDGNGNGVRDPGEVGLPGWQITINGSQTSFAGYLSSSVITDAQGNYSFTGLWPGTYTIAEVMQSGWVRTTPTSGNHTVTIAAGQGLNNRNFGNRLVSTVRVDPIAENTSPRPTDRARVEDPDRLRTEAPRQLEKLMDAYRNRRMNAIMEFFTPEFRGNRDEIRRNIEKDWRAFSGIDMDVIPMQVLPGEQTVEIEFNWRNHSRHSNGEAAQRQGRSRIVFRPGSAIFDRWGIIAIEGDPFLGAGLDMAPKPRVISFSPRSGQSGVALDEAVVFEFSTDMDPGSLRSALVVEPSIDLTFEQFGRGFTVRPRSSWRANTEYRVRLSDIATDLIGVPLDDRVEFTFRTLDDAVASSPDGDAMAP
jgi:hypothetical protein